MTGGHIAIVAMYYSNEVQQANNLTDHLKNELPL